MSIVRRAVLLLLVGLCTGAPLTTEECDAVNKTLPTKDLHTIFGNWVLVWSVTDTKQCADLLANLSSSHLELRLRPDNKTIVYIENNMFLDNSCTSYLINISMPSDPTSADHHTLITHMGTVETHGVVHEYLSGSVDFYESCADCLLFVFKSSIGQYLLSYRREGQHQDVEQLKAAESDHQKWAECLGFSHERPFIYDGAADFCHKKPSAVANAELF
ncbi:hypothetical protein PAMP_008577 [Pampus punctatissimus]